MESARPGNIKYDGEGDKRTLPRRQRPASLFKDTQANAAGSEQINLGTEDKEERRRLTFSAVAWKKKAPISRRMLKEGEVLEEGPLKHDVDSLEFVHVAGG